MYCRRTNIRMRALKHLLLSLVIILGSFTFFGNMYIRFHYASVMPRIPQPDSGRVYPIPAQYGGTIYVNQAELDRRNFLSNQMTSAFAVVMVFTIGLGMYLEWWPVGPTDQRSKP
jgi:hypothetical protein